MNKTFINKIFFGEHGEIMRYIFFGCLNVVVTWISYAIFVLSGIDPSISNALSWILGVAFAFVVNKTYVFNSKTTDSKKVGKEAASFTLGRIATGLIALVGFPILYSLGLDQQLLGVDGFLSKMIVSGVEIGLNYIFSKYIVFNHPKNN